MSSLLDKYNERKEFEVPSGIKIRKTALGEISFKVSPTTSKDEVIRGLRMMVGSHQEKPELRQDFTITRWILFSGLMRKIRYIYGNTLAKVRITQHGIVTWPTDLISNGLTRHGIR